MNYCKHYATLGGKFRDGTILTDITIPPGCGVRMLQYVINIVLQHDGQILDNPAIGITDSSILLTVTFSDNEARQKCSQKIDETISQFIQMTDIECGSKTYEIDLNSKVVLSKFHEIMDILYPVMDYIKYAENGSFYLYDLFKTAASWDEITEEQIEDFITFIGAYMIGQHLCNDKIAFLGKDKITI